MYASGPLAICFVSLNLCVNVGNHTLADRILRDKTFSRFQVQNTNCIIVFAQVIFGGRNGIGYFDDVWAYRLSTASWEDWTPTTVGSPAPIGRDHFGAVYDSGHIYIYGMSSMATCNAHRVLALCTFDLGHVVLSS